MPEIDEIIKERENLEKDETHFDWADYFRRYFEITNNTIKPFCDSLTHLSPDMRKFINLSKSRDLVNIKGLDWMVTKLFLDSSS